MDLFLKLVILIQCCTCTFPTCVDGFKIFFAFLWQNVKNRVFSLIFLNYVPGRTILMINQCGGSGMFIPDLGSDFFPSRSRIPDPNCLHPGSRILIKEFKYFNPKKAKKWCLSSKKYDPGCSSRIPDPDADSPIPDPGSRIQGSKRHPIPDPGSGSATLW